MGLSILKVYCWQLILKVQQEHVGQTESQGPGFPCRLLILQSSVLPPASGHESVMHGHEYLSNCSKLDTEDADRRSPLCKQSSGREGACIIKSLADIL